MKPLNPSQYDQLCTSLAIPLLAFGGGVAARVFAARDERARS